MSARPWMPLYVADYLADTAHLGAQQSGAYLHLIMHYWQHGALPEGDDALMRVARLTPAEWKRERVLLAGFFQDGWRHPRIDAELARADTRIAAKSEAGRRGAVKRWQGHLAAAGSGDGADDAGRDPAGSVADDGADSTAGRPGYGSAGGRGGEPGDGDGDADADADAMAAAMAEAASSHRSADAQLQSQPDSAPSLRSGAPHARPRMVRGTRIPPGFVPDVIVAQRLGLSAYDAAIEAANFVDYWRARAANATKLDWHATWRVWCRRAARDIGGPGETGDGTAAFLAPGMRLALGAGMGGAGVGAGNGGAGSGVHGPPRSVSRPQRTINGYAAHALALAGEDYAPTKPSLGFDRPERAEHAAAEPSRDQRAEHAATDPGPGDDRSERGERGPADFGPGFDGGERGGHGSADSRLGLGERGGPAPAAGGAGDDGAAAAGSGARPLRPPDRGVDGAEPERTGDAAPALTEAETRALAARLAELTASLALRDPRRVERAVTAMLLCFPSGRASGEEARVVVAAYAAALGDLPPWAVNAAARRFVRGEAGAATPAFPPSSAELARIARDLAAAVEREAAALRRVLDGTAETPRILKGRVPPAAIADDAARRLAEAALKARAAALGLDPDAALAGIAVPAPAAPPALGLDPDAALAGIAVPAPGGAPALGETLRATAGDGPAATPGETLRATAGDGLAATPSETLRPTADDALSLGETLRATAGDGLAATRGDAIAANAARPP